MRFPEKEGFKIPHMGWNSISIQPESRLLRGIPEGSYVYFVHSYYLKAENPSDVAATADYIVDFHAAVEHDWIADSAKFCDYEIGKFSGGKYVYKKSNSLFGCE